MKKIIVSGLIAGVVLLIFSVAGLYLTIWFFPNLALQYYDPAFNNEGHRYLIYFIHPFIISQGLSWFWDRFKEKLTGSYIALGIEFGLVYVIIAIIPMMCLIYSALSISTTMVATWLVFGLLQGTISGLLFEKINPITTTTK